MVRKYNLSKNNKGSTMILVVICIAFVSILASLMLSLTVSNLEMKVVNQKTKANFYSTESAFDEMKAGLEEVTADSLEYAYNAVMEQYITKSESDKEKLFSKTFIEQLVYQLGEGATKDAITYDRTKLKNYIKNTEVDFITPSGSNLFVKDIVNTDNPKYLTLKNVKVSYTDSDNYKTTISADITIHTPDMGFQSTVGLSPVFSAYSLIADNRISLDAATNVNISGNVYSGQNGIQINNESSLQISNASEIITRGDITVLNRSSLNVLDNPDLWAKNLGTGKETDSNTLVNTAITINGKCYVADDLTLNSKNSLVTINGEYYGYSYQANKTLTSGEDVNNPGYSSAIIINGENTSLDMSGTNKLFLAGRAYLDPKSNGNGLTRPQDNIKTGEALAVKGNQYAYLVPAEFLWCGSNPVTIDEYNSRPATTKEVDFTKTLADNPGFKITDYADGFLNIFYQPTSGSQLVYYYLKFKSEEKANEYIQKYYEAYNTRSGSGAGIIDNRIKSFAKSIKLKNPITSLLSAGDIFTFDGDTNLSSLIPNSVKPEETASGGTTNPSYQAMKEVAANLVKQYDAMQKTLTDNKTDAYDPDSIFNSLIMKEKIQSDSTHDSGFVNKVKRVIVDGENVVTIVDNKDGPVYEIKADNNLPGKGTHGIVIATGSVFVNDNFTGLIMSGGDITISGGKTVTGSANIVETILDYNNSQVNRYFRDYAELISGGSSDEATDKIIVSDLILYDNWEKNEE